MKLQLLYIAYVLLLKPLQIQYDKNKFLMDKNTFNMINPTHIWLEGQYGISCSKIKNTFLDNLWGMF